MARPKYNFNFFGVRKKAAPINLSSVSLIPSRYRTSSRPLLSVNTKTQIKDTVKFWTFGPTKLFKKESTNQKHLSKWGDADMDGSPNYFDCDPVDWLKDRKNIDPKEFAKFGKKDKPQITTPETKPKKTSRFSPAKKRRSAREKYEILLKGYRAKKRPLESEKISQSRAMVEAALERGKVPRQKYIKKLAESMNKQIIYRAEPSEIESRYKQKLEKIEPEFKTKTELATMTKGARRKYEAQFSKKAIEQREARINKIKEKMAIENRIEKERGAHQRVEGIKKVLTGQAAVEAIKSIRVSPEAIVERGAAIVKAAPQALKESYGKEERLATQKVRRYVKAGVGGLFGASLTQTKFGPAVRGRPAGPSGKYMIEGKPVFEEEYQKYAAQQRALNRLTPSTQQQTPLPDTTQEMQPQEIATSQPDQTVYPSSSNPMSISEIQATKQMAIPTKTAPSEELRAAQEIAQKQDNILNAPNFMNGELKATGGSLLTPSGPQILDAPNAFKGELRNLNRTGEIPAVRLGERPQTNPYGDDYIDIELGSGRPILKRRIREKWMDGSAL